MQDLKATMKEIQKDQMTVDTSIWGISFLNNFSEIKNKLWLNLNNWWIINLNIFTSKIFKLFIFNFINVINSRNMGLHENSI